MNSVYIGKNPKYLNNKELKKLIRTPRFNPTSRNDLVIELSTRINSKREKTKGEKNEY